MISILRNTIVYYSSFLSFSFSFRRSLSAMEIVEEKQSRPNRLRSTLTLDNGQPGLQIKPFMDAYMEQTSDLRSESSWLFISLNKPHNSITTLTFLCSACTLKEILKIGCWKNTSTYKRYYEAELLD